MRCALLGVLTLLAGLTLVPPARAADLDLSDPRKTMLSNAAAGQAGDLVGLQSCYYVPDSAKEAMRIYVSYLRAYNELRRAAVAKFGADAARIFHPPGLNAPEDVLGRALNEGKLTTNGNRATLVFRVSPNPNAVVIPETTIQFQKVNERWLIDAGSIFKMDKPEQAEETRKTVAVLGALAEAIAGVADRTNAGKYLSVQEMQTALEEKQALAVRTLALAATTAPATTSQPAPKTSPKFK